MPEKYISVLFSGGLDSAVLVAEAAASTAASAGEARETRVVPIYISVGFAWEDEERAMLAKLLARKAPASELVNAAVEHHRAYKVFRRSLRALSLENVTVRKARAESRRRQIDQIKSWVAPAKPSSIQVATILLQMERLADAVAEGEFADLGLEDGVARETLADLQMRLQNPMG